ncbi:amidohydrolase family protein [Aestuariimicrobium sp. T2.26MG-19.2B]|uniref:amidohydrolase family protein n=1 Tax=Aestuariimicrobium sp. T2.26MG-19.2B TaxID=3040679 RepID=UPI0024777E8F|nr:amidohydrolase family protein [Aestuariimicrobium sp. T2.26MG-19.2B]CAI9407174.1 N-isopropylammelide isopropyl amidohydrolase [Aestuariimicrobium sp. T2.26MG-19.2B]
MTLTVLQDVRPWGGPATDLYFEDGRVVPPPNDQAVGEIGERIDGRGRIALPSFADVHVHLCSTRWGLPFRPHTAPPSLMGHIEADRQGWRQDAPIAVKATAMLGRMISRGTTKVRSYAQIDTHAGLERLEGVLAAKEHHSALADVTVMAFPQSGIMIDPGTESLLDDALRQGLVDVVGGIDPCAVDRDPKGHLDVVFGLAERYGKPVDLHVHETGTMGAFSWDLIFERTRALGMQGQVTISHAMALGTNSPEVEDRLFAQLVELDVAIATVAPRGSRPLPYRRLLAEGVRVGLGEDGMRDYWSPYGDGDHWNRLFQLCWQHNLKTDEELRAAAFTATVGGRQVIDPSLARVDPLVGTPGLEIGDEADLVLVEGETLSSAVVDHRPSRVLIRAGRVVVDVDQDDPTFSV